MALRATFQSIISMSALPSPQALVDPRVGVFGRLLAGQLLLHAFHPGAKRVAAFAALWLRSLQAGLARVGLVVRRPPFGIQAALVGLAFFACPGCGLSHNKSAPRQLRSCRHKFRLLPTHLHRE